MSSTRQKELKKLTASVKTSTLSTFFSSKLTKHLLKVPSFQNPLCMPTFRFGISLRNVEWYREKMSGIKWGDE